jgi:acetyl-CoA acetyltransferase
VRTGLAAGGEEPRERRAADAAWAQAGLGPQDVHVAEVHDAAAPAELMAVESLGLCGPGGAVAMLADGDLALGGRLPVNPSGGLVSKGHPLGATGCGQVVELVTQLRGEAGARQVDGARVAVAENAGGYLHPDPAVCVVTVLSRD